MPGRPTIWMIVGQGPVAHAVGAGGGCFDIFTFLCLFSPLSPSLWETAQCRLKYCFKGPLNSTINQPNSQKSARDMTKQEEQELEVLVESLDKNCTCYKMEISAKRTKLMKNSTNGIQREIKVKGQKLGTVTNFKYLGAIVSGEGSKPEVLSRIEQATAALTKLKPVWRHSNISVGPKVKLTRFFVISIFLYACETWTLTAELETS